jgi:hypothetical protein
MNVRQEINDHSLPEERDMLNWLFDRYHTSSTWGFVAYCAHVRYGDQSYQVHRCWRPKPAGRDLYHYANAIECVRDIVRLTEISDVWLPVSWREDAREALAKADAQPPPDPASGWAYDKDKKRYIKSS